MHGDAKKKATGCSYAVVIKFESPHVANKVKQK